MMWMPRTLILILMLGLFGTIPTVMAAVPEGCAELFDSREAGLNTPPEGVAQVTCAAFFPFAVAIDGNEATRVEVRIIGQGITSVELGTTISVVGVKVDGEPFPQTGGFIQLFDNGTHGDLVAGDGIWSRDSISVDAVVGSLPIREMVFNQVRYTDDGGTQTINIWNSLAGQYGPARLGGLEASLSQSTIEAGNGFYLTPNVVFMVDDYAFAELRWLLRARPPTADILSVGQRFYDFMPDDFDTLLMMPGAHVPGGNRGGHLSGGNSIEGIGTDIHDLSSKWGSAGRLKSVPVLNWSSSGPVLHEIMHNWAVKMSTDLGFQQCAPAHWGMVGSGNGILGGFNPQTLVDNGDGTWSFPNGEGSNGGSPADTRSFSTMELYLAGFIPPEEVPPIKMPVNVDCKSIAQDLAAQTISFAADDVITRTIDDVIAEHGPRIPAAADSQKDFNMAWLVPINRRPTQTEAGFMQYRAEYIARRQAGDMPFRLTFWEAAGGRATLNTQLEMYSEEIFTDRFQHP